MKISSLSLSIGLLLAFGVLIAVYVVNLHLTQNLTGHLERAANANTVEMAKQELKIALQYMETNNLTSGYTSVFYKTPDEDIGYWYQNIRQAYQELEEIGDDTSSLEKSNLLMKLRETLQKEGKDGTVLIYPEGLSRYPYNFWWGLAIGLAILYIPIASAILKLRI